MFALHHALVSPFFFFVVFVFVFCFLVKAYSYHASGVNSLFSENVQSFKKRKNQIKFLLKNVVKL